MRSFVLSTILALLLLSPLLATQAFPERAPLRAAPEVEAASAMDFSLCADCGDDDSADLLECVILALICWMIFPAKRAVLGRSRLTVLRNIR